VKDLGYKLMTFAADLFLMDVKNEIYFDPTTFQNANYLSPVRHYGLEMEAKMNLFEGKLKPYVFYTLQRSFFKGGVYAGNLVPFVPENKIAAGFTATPIKNFNWTLNMNYVGSRFLISDQNNIAPKLKDYTTFDTSFDYKFKWVKAWFSIKNMFSKEYFPYGVSNSTGAQTFYPAPERSFEFGMQVEF
jgi:outer membrane receptor protein involved in Fe transport